MAIEIKVDTDVPIPGARKRGSGLMATMRGMKVGDSFLYPRHKRSDLCQLSRRAGIKITTRLEDETQVRCWRIE